MTSNQATTGNKKTKLIITIGAIGFFVAGFITYESRTNAFGLFQNSLDEARASLAVGDTQSAEQLYLDYIKNNLEDPQARIELIDLLTSQARTEDALPIASQLVKDFPTKDNAQKYRALVQTSHETHDLIARDALREKDKQKFIDAVKEAQNALILSPKIALPVALVEDDSNLKIFVENDAAKCSSDICFPHAFKSEEMHPIANFVSYEIYKETELAVVFQSAVSEILRTDAIASRAISAFPTDLVAEQFESKFVFESFVELMAAEALYDLAKRLPIGKNNVALKRCIDLTDSLGITADDLLKRQKRGLYRACMSHKLRLAVESFSPEQVATILDDWKYGANRLCGLNRESVCHERVRMFSWGVNTVRDEEHAASSFVKPAGEFIMDVVDPLYQNENKPDLRDLASSAFDEENWDEAARLYSALGHFQELYGADRSWGQPTSNVIAENKYNAAMALWNDDRRAESIALLETIVKEYPDYTSAQTALGELRPAFERIPNPKALIEYARLKDAADALADKRGDDQLTAEAYASAAEEYKDATGRDDAYTLTRAYLFHKFADNFSDATYYIDRAFKADETFTFNSGATVADLRAEWQLNLPYKRARQRASQNFADEQWLSAYSNFKAAEEYAIELKEVDLAAECAYNAAISMYNNDQLARAKEIFGRIQYDYPSYKPRLVAEEIRDINSRCPNSYLGC